MYLYTIATVTVHICTVIVARVFDLLLFFLSPTSDSHLNSLFLISSQLSLSLISTLLSSLFLSSQLCTAKSISLSDPTIQSASPIISTCRWTRWRHSAHMKTTGLLDGPWFGDPRPWRFRIRWVLAEASLPSWCLDLWLLGFDPFFIICLISVFWDFIWLGWMGWWWWLCGCSIWLLMVAGGWVWVILGFCWVCERVLERRGKEIIKKCKKNKYFIE